MPYAFTGRRYGSFAAKAKAAPVAVAEAVAAVTAAAALYIPKPTIYVEMVFVQFPRPFVAAREQVTHIQRTARIRALRPRVIAREGLAEAVHVAALPVFVACAESVSMAEFASVRMQASCEAREQVRFSSYHKMMIEVDDVLLGIR